MNPRSSQLGLFAAMLLIAAPGCGPKAPPDPTAELLEKISGDWLFDEAAYLESFKAHAENQAQQDELLKEYAEAKKAGTPDTLAADLTIHGRFVRVVGYKPEEEFEIVKAEKESDGRYRCQVDWRPDRTNREAAESIVLLVAVDPNRIRLGFLHDFGEIVTQYSRKP